MAVAKQDHIYRVVFLNQDKVYEIFVKNVYQSDMWGFIEIEDFIFGSRSDVLVDPSEDKLKQQFEGVNRSYIPMQAIVRIDEVKKEGVAKITDIKGNVSAFPIMPPPSKP
ncbi:DUF1820 family protein [Neptunomonas phycophila]|jgi:hypothetical protein|uniref:DUF1820 family protein n=1 Tax=Neptunomonas phycophila TaxID=1572645 RepID=A0AAW7XLC5_9GAMM|nr:MULTISPECIES: DUF1820 family protein [Neptunomonas]MBT3145426.1 DUF1820 family protein [Neptunomonas phycophila]MDN2658199.1 DUF1820 family protein [Neptunomonas sp. CHC150]MDO6455057.1 DUF1820 family protein [Neptunomonas phycophila]MDO6468554.1 DUF1820 family protein [Neptunomonas phycophila]MDO6785458.1 DUF1820 family protein [Neptunomonas phycophila]